jgi:hypothetical protein
VSSIQEIRLADMCRLAPIRTWSRQSQSARIHVKTCARLDKTAKLQRILSVISHYKVNPLNVMHEAIQLYEKAFHVQTPNFFLPSIHSLFFGLKY